MRSPTPAGEANTLYRYEGLRLVDHTDGRYLLITDAWEPGAGRVILIEDDDVLALEFSR